MNGFNAPLSFVTQHPWRPIVICTAFHGALIGLLAYAYPVTPACAAILLAIAASAVACSAELATHWQRFQVLLWSSEGSFSVTTYAGARLPADVDGQPLDLGFMVLLPLRVAGVRYVWTILRVDTSPVAYRRLRVRLRYGFVARTKVSAKA